MRFNTPRGGLNLANQISRMLWVFGQELEGSHAIFHSHLENIHLKNKSKMLKLVFTI